MASQWDFDRTMLDEFSLARTRRPRRQRVRVPTTSPYRLTRNGSAAEPPEIRDELPAWITPSSVNAGFSSPSASLKAPKNSGLKLESSACSRSTRSSRGLIAAPGGGCPSRSPRTQERLKPSARYCNTSQTARRLQRRVILVRHSDRSSSIASLAALFGGVTVVAAEQPQRVLVSAYRRLLPVMHGAQVAEELLGHDRGPRPRELVGHPQEPLHDPDPACDRVVVEVAAQLLVALSLNYLPHRLRLSVQQWNRAHRIDATALIDRQNGLQPVSSNE